MWPKGLWKVLKVEISFSPFEWKLIKWTTYGYALFRFGPFSLSFSWPQNKDNGDF